MLPIIAFLFCLLVRADIPPGRPKRKGRFAGTQISFCLSITTQTSPYYYLNNMAQQLLLPHLKASPTARQSHQVLVHDNNGSNSVSRNHNHRRRSSQNKTLAEAFQPTLAPIHEVKGSKKCVGYIKPRVQQIAPPSTEYPRSSLSKRSWTLDEPCARVVSPTSLPPYTRPRLFASRKEEHSSSVCLTERFQAPACDPSRLKIPQRQHTLSANSLAELQEECSESNSP